MSATEVYITRCATYRGLMQSARNRSYWAVAGTFSLKSLRRNVQGGWGVMLQPRMLKDGAIIWYGKTDSSWTGYWFPHIEPFIQQVFCAREGIEIKFK